MRTTDGRTDMVIPVYPPNFVARGIIKPSTVSTLQQTSCAPHHTLGLPMVHVDRSIPSLISADLTAFHMEAMHEMILGMMLRSPLRASNTGAGPRSRCGLVSCKDKILHDSINLSAPQSNETHFSWKSRDIQFYIFQTQPCFNFLVYCKKMFS